MMITVTSRPYLMTFAASGHAYTLTSEEAQRVIDGNPVVRYSCNRVILQGGNDAKAYNRVTLRPATLGGGPAFTLTT